MSKTLEEIFNPSYTWQTENEWRWEERDGYYRAELNGDVAYFAYHGKDGSDDGGWGGWEFKVIMIDGSVRDIKGPWSSNSEQINKMYPEKRKLHKSYTCFNFLAMAILQKIYN